MYSNHCDINLINYPDSVGLDGLLSSWHPVILKCRMSWFHCRKYSSLTAERLEEVFAQAHGEQFNTRFWSCCKRANTTWTYGGGKQNQL